MERFFASRWSSLAAALLIAVITFAVYYPTIDASFQYDDLNVLFQGEAIAKPRELIGVITSTRGVSLASFALNNALYGPEPRAYHLTNIAVHVVVSISAYFFVMLTFARAGMEKHRAAIMALAAALVFAVHPIQTSAVSYIIQRMEILAALFYLLALIAFIIGSSSPGRSRWGWYALTALLYLAAFKSKESAITLPAIILLYDYIFISKANFKGILARWPLYSALAVLLVIFSTVTFTNLSKSSAALEGEAKKAGALLSQTMPATRLDKQTTQITPRVPTVSAGFELETITPKDYLYTQFNVVLYYISLLAIPANQNVDYDFPVSHALFKTPQANPNAVLNYPIPPPFISLMILLGMALGACLLYYYKRRAIGTAVTAAFFVFWFFIVISPTSSFVPISDVIFEHRVYLASIGFFVIIIILIDALIGLSLKRFLNKG